MTGGEDEDAYFLALSTADAPAAVAIIDEALASGEAPRHLVSRIMVPAQRRVGEMWFRGAWSVADEHAATSIAEQALTLLSPPKRVRPEAPRVVLACAEGEWHTMPARLAAELARTPDIQVSVLGGSIPAPQLHKHLESTRPRALALSCTMATNLIGASRCVQAAHGAGVPVVAGGAAWGHSRHRAQALGVDLWLEDPTQLQDALPGLEGVVPGSEVALPPEALLLDTTPRELLLLALERHRAASPWMREMTPFQQAQTIEDLRWLARHAAAAVVCDDATIVRSLLAWLLALLSPRGVPPAAVIDSCYFLADAVEHEAPRAAGILRLEANRARAQADASTTVAHPEGGEPTV